MTLIAYIVLHRMSYIAQSEQENIRQWQAEGNYGSKSDWETMGQSEHPAEEEEHALLWRKKNISLMHNQKLSNSCK